MHLDLMKYSRLAFSGNFVFMWGMISFYCLAFPLYILVIRNRTLKKTLMCVKQILLPNKIIPLCLLFSVSSGNGEINNWGMKCMLELTVERCNIRMNSSAGILNLLWNINQRSHNLTTSILLWLHLWFLHFCWDQF